MDPTAYCRPSPRSWTKAASDLSNLTNSGKVTSIDFQSLLVAGRVGAASAVKFRTWLEYYKELEPLIDIILKGGKLPNISTLSMEKVIVLGVAVCGHISVMCQAKPKSPKDKAEIQAKIHKTTHNVFSWVSMLPAELQIHILRSTINREHISKWQMVDVQVFSGVFATISKIMYDYKE